MGLYDKTLGVLLLGIIINTYFFGFVIYQYISYFNRGYKDSLWVNCTAVPERLRVFRVAKLGGLFSILNSLIYMAWLYCVQFYGNPTIFTTVPWPSSYTPVANAISSILTHQFLTARASHLMESKLVYVGIMALSMGNFVAAIISAVKSWMAKNANDQRNLKVDLIAWLSIQAGVDIIVAGTLSYALYRARTGYHRTDGVIYRLIRGAVRLHLCDGAPDGLPNLPGYLCLRILRWINRSHVFNSQQFHNSNTYLAFLIRLPEDAPIIYR
ncbi:hypothetical protein IW261DRAFT_1419220 [Armillaria novae-zelandiae]|uniref:Uncharacterized protein n=1 Tax=Armillaria novae-zelandiae TaxID=153914 RepID=A0AA39PAZ2_9AGAR|nr:hypothetical protein IW261DRAFT_1419220 [Armillaria novae-zelandiae]